MPGSPDPARADSPRRLRQIVKQYAVAAGITKRVYPHLFRHQLLTYLTQQGIISPKLQLLSGHTTEQSLAMYRELTLGDNRLRVFRSANTAHLGHGVGQERWLRVGPSEKYAAR